MSHHDLISLLLQLSIMAITALVFGEIVRRMHQPAVFGELIGGILIGPTVLGVLFPDLQSHLFPSAGPAFIGRESVIKLGLLFFLFVAGMEINLTDVNKRRGQILITSISGIIIPFIAGFCIVWFFPQFFYIENEKLGFAVFLGIALSISALPVIARILMDCNLLKTPLGAVIISTATIDDLIGWTLFAFILSSYVPEARPAYPPAVIGIVIICLFAFVLTLGRTWGEMLMKRLRAAGARFPAFLGTMAILVMLFSALTEWIGVHAIFGAFLVGVALAPKPEDRTDAHESLYQFVTTVFAAPIYFVSIGLKINFAAHFDFFLILIVLLVACFGKIIGAGLGAWASGFKPREAISIGFGMNARGAMEIILATIALDYGLIDERIFVALVVTAVVTSLMSGPIIKALNVKA